MVLHILEVLICPFPRINNTSSNSFPLLAAVTSDVNMSITAVCPQNVVLEQMSRHVWKFRRKYDKSHLIIVGSF